MVLGFNSLDVEWDENNEGSGFFGFNSNMESCADDQYNGKLDSNTNKIIPDKCVARVLLFLTPSQVLSIDACVCHRWSLIALDNFVWKRFFIRDWAHPMQQDIAPNVSVETRLDNPFRSPHNRRWLNRYRDRIRLVRQIHKGAIQRAQTVDGMLSGMRWEWTPYMEAGVIDQWDKYVLINYSGMDENNKQNHKEQQKKQHNINDSPNNNNNNKNNNNNNTNQLNNSDDEYAITHRHAVPQSTYCHTLLRILPRNHQVSFSMHILGLLISAGVIYGSVLCPDHDRQHCSCRADGSCPGWSSEEYSYVMDLLNSSNGYVRMRAVLVVIMLIQSNMPMSPADAERLDSWLVRMLRTGERQGASDSEEQEESSNARVWELAAVDILNALHDSFYWEQGLSTVVPKTFPYYGPALENIERWADKRRDIQVQHMELEQTSINDNNTMKDSGNKTRYGSWSGSGAGSALRRLSNNLSLSRRRTSSSASISPPLSSRSSTNSNSSNGEGIMFHSVYVIHVVIGVREWVLRKTYRQFYELKQSLRAAFPHLRRSLPRLPKETEKEEESVKKMNSFIKLCLEEREIWRSMIMQEFTTTDSHGSQTYSLMDTMSPKTEKWDLWSVSI